MFIVWRGIGDEGFLPSAWTRTLNGSRIGSPKALSLFCDGHFETHQASARSRRDTSARA
jgi:hypothetical protein